MSLQQSASDSHDSPNSRHPDEPPPSSSSPEAPHPAVATSSSHKPSAAHPMQPIRYVLILRPPPKSRFHQGMAEADRSRRRLLKVTRDATDGNRPSSAQEKRAANGRPERAYHVCHMPLRGRRGVCRVRLLSSRAGGEPPGCPTPARPPRSARGPKVRHRHHLRRRQWESHPRHPPVA